MENTGENQNRSGDLRDLAELELADIIATANNSGFSTEEVLDAMSTAVEAMRKSLAKDPDQEDDPGLILARDLVR
jgi:hypothetical protein